MTRFSYLAAARDGRLVRGAIEASDTVEAQRSIDALQLQLITLKPARNLHARRRGQLRPASALQAMLADLERLLRAKMPLADALGLLAERRDKGALVAKDVLAEIRAGASLSVALRKLDPQPKPEITALVAAGEVTGELGVQLRTIVEGEKRRAALRKEIISQLIYPAALLVLTAATLYFLAFFVLPQFEDLFSDPGVDTPAVSMGVIEAGRWIRDWAWLVPAMILLVLISVRFARRRYRSAWDAALLRLPLVGGLIRTAEAGRFCQSLGAMLEGGCTLSDALPIARQAVGYVPLVDAHKEAADAIRRGAPPSRALGAANLLPGDGLRLLAISERTGTLGPTLSEIALSYQQDVGQAIKRLSVLTGPLLTALMGVLIAGVIAAVMLGVLGLNDILQ